ncbi:pickpocket protein 28-like [Haematobia irritans]|uniref:pickpocket protein 28-like n=1 Tax=Haematobia irritans TaxID=7368 RepID=UPI003F504C87
MNITSRPKLHSPSRNSFDKPLMVKRKSSLNLKKVFSENTEEFCTHSTLHGLKYVVDEHLYPAERIFFALSFVVVVVVSAFFIRDVYSKWRSTPVIVGLSPEPSFIINEPFPAVTLCNLNQASKKRAMQYKEDTSEYAMLQMLCKNDVNMTIASGINWNKFEEFILNVSKSRRDVNEEWGMCRDWLNDQRFLFVPHVNPYQINVRTVSLRLFDLRSGTVGPNVTVRALCSKKITVISQPCEEMIIACNYGALDYNCKDIFRTIVTDEGLCCVFNKLHPEFMYKISKRNEGYKDDAVAVNWNPESGYPKELPPKFYPRTAVGTGQTLGLSLTFDVDINDYYCSSATSVGIKMALHSPAEVPHVREIGTLLPAGSETKIRIRPDKTEAALNLKSINKQYRQCLFNGEKHLVYFSHYNRRNCEMECHARQLLKNCGCLSYYMPLIGNNSRICGILDTPCIDRVIQNKLNQSRAVLEDCQHVCWPSCFDLNFYSDFFSAPISHQGFEVANKLVKNVSSEYAEKSMAVAHFYFTDNTFRSTRQTEFVGITDFLSSVGGLMGLFMGFSFISIAEFIYYAILRPYHKIKRHDRVNQTNARTEPIRNYQVRFVSPSNKQGSYNIPEHLMNSTKLQLFPPQTMGRQQYNGYSNQFNNDIQWNRNNKFK